MEPSVRSPLHSICIVNIDITLLYLYILRVSVQSIVHFLNVHIYYVSLNLPFDSFRTANWKYVFQIITSCFQNRTSCQFFGFFFFVFFTPFISFILYISFQWCRGFCYLIVYNNRPAVRYHWISAATLFQRLISFPLRWDSNFCIQDGAAQTEVISRQEISVGSVVMVVGPNEKSERPSKLQSAPLTNYGCVITTFFF